MKKLILYWSILTIPFIGMILTNEIVRLHINSNFYNNQVTSDVNTSIIQKKKCTWICHDNTNYCKVNHVKFAKPYFNIIDPIYFGIINSLKLTGNYGLANILVLVILFPLIIYFLLVKSISIQFEICELKKNK